jgi:uncharacterized repeat protein (TIGR01451 family)
VSLPAAGILSTDPKDPSIARIGAGLAGLWDQYQAGLPAGASTAGAVSTASVSGDGQQVPLAGSSVVIDAVASGSVANLASDLTGLGAVITGEAGVMVSALLPVSEIYAANSLTSMAFATPSQSEADIGAVTSQGDVAMGSDIARSTFGYDGAGVTVGVISNSYNNLGGAAKDVSTGDLPGVGNPDGFTTPVKVIQDDPSGGDDEGRAMLQIVHDVAPGANLDFATGELGQANFANNIVKLASAGAKVIVDDLVDFEEPFFQDSVIAQAVEKVAAKGVDYFSAAGNQASNSYQANFTAGGTYAPGSFSGGLYFYGGVAQSFGATDYDSIKIDSSATSNSFVKIGLQWQSPYASLGDAGGATSDLDLYLINSSGKVVAESAGYSVGHDPIQYMTYTNTSGAPLTYKLMIVEYAGSTPGAIVKTGSSPGLIKYIDFLNGAGGVTDPAATASASSTVIGHSNVAAPNGALLMSAVGAADYTKTPAFGVTPAVLESFSSLGGTPILYSDSGAPLGTPLVPQQPNIVAPDGVSTTFFQQSRPLSDGFFAFFGTSAAAPHAAAVAAIMLQAKPSLTLAQIQFAMDSTATSVGGLTPGTYNPQTGNGFLNADAAITSLGISARASGDLAVKLSASATTVIPGTDLTYTVTVTNKGPGDAEAVTLTDAVPTNTELASYSGLTGWTSAFAAGVVTHTVAALAPGASGTFTIVFYVKDNTPPGSISDTATVSGSPPDLNLSNNSQTVTTNVLSGAALLPDPLNVKLRDLVVTGSPSTTSIVFTPGPGGTVSTCFNGVLLGYSNPTGRIVAYGNAANQTIYVSPQITVPAFLYGSTGNNILIAGGGDSVLVGGAGNNSLQGGPESNILISGLGKSTLNGHSGNNIEIGGYTTFDNTSFGSAGDVALESVLAEWSSSDSYATRVADISGGPPSGLNLNGSDYFIAGTTVFNNGAADSLYGGTGTNWYFAHTSGASPLDKIFSNKPGEVIDAI